MKRLKELRNLKQKTQAEVAFALGISQQAYANYEAGKREPDNAMLCLLSKYFCVTVDYLLGWDEPKKEAAQKDEPPLDPEVKKRLDRLNEIFPLLTPEQQDAVNALIKSLQPGK